MTTTKDCIAAEDVMALLDGELSVADARVVSAHIGECSECALVAEQLRNTSESLSRWSVPAVSRAVEECVERRIEKVASRRETTGRGRSLVWRLVVVGGGGVVLGGLLLLVIGMRHPYEYARSMSEAITVAEPPLQDMKRQDEGLYSRERRSGPPPAVAGVAGMVDGSLAAHKNAAGSIGQLIGGSQASAPMISRMMSLSIVVKDVDAARASLDSILARHRGFSAQLSVTSPENGARYTRASLRIPAPELASAAAEIKALGRVENESQTGEEVSQQHTDLVARLKTARETEERFQAILQQRTGKVSDVLEVEQNIARVRGEIEGMEAEQKALEHRVDFASVEVVLREEYKAQLGSLPDSASTRVNNAFVAGYHNATESLLGVVLFAEEFGPTLMIWLAILGLPAAWVWRRYKRARAGL